MKQSAIDIGVRKNAPSTAVAPEFHPHSVQFYEDDDFLVGFVADFVASALECGKPALVVAGGIRREGILQALRLKGSNPDRRLRDRDLVMLDARETLDSFTTDGVPDPGRFDEVVGEFYNSIMQGRDGELFAYGEMVDLLWRDGYPEGSLQIETLWNDFAARQPLKLLCAYSLYNFSSAGDTGRFLEICGHHSHVLPTERYSLLDDGARLSAISVLQQQAQALQNELAERVRTEERLQEALAEQEALHLRERSARLEAEGANRAKRDFLAMMSHELRTPLNAIAGYAELLELGVRGSLSEGQRDFLDRIRRSQQNLLALIDDVLLFARADSGGVRYATESVPIAEILRSVAASVAPYARDRGVQLEFVDCEPTVVARGDREQVLRILRKLLSNASKFTNPGGEIEVRCEVRGREVHVLVCDSGIGIPSGKLEGLFEPFVQVDSQLTREFQGAGLGLAISRRLARGMGGDIVATSAPNRGSTFTLILPLAAS